VDDTTRGYCGTLEQLVLRSTPNDIMYGQRRDGQVREGCSQL
jgi:hypothetical protein